MKLNTSLFICLFFSAIIAIKAGVSKNEDNEYLPENETEESVEPSVEVDQDVQIKDNDQQEPQADDFKFKPSKRLEMVENNMPDSAQAFVQEGKVEETLKDTYASTMATDVARTGLENANHEWQMMLLGPEASKVVGTFGNNFKNTVTSPIAADLINIVATTVHVLLAKAGEEKMSSGLSDIMSLTYSMFTSPNMPDIINKTGGLVITFANKPKAPLFVKTYWKEVRKLLGEKNLAVKLNKYFTNIMSMMKSLSGIMRGGRKPSGRYNSTR